ncbi:hypothetical protein GR255_28380, partial [Mycobacterium tuberculosis]|nr:hypothetical protein [Mycobacterium tuberculosis]
RGHPGALREYGVRVLVIRPGQVRSMASRAGIGTRGHVSELRLMAVHAHPDDESSKGAATLARCASTVFVCW